MLLIGAAYGAFALLTRDAPPPPSLDRPAAPGFQVALDGRWFDRHCRSLRIVGGWLLPEGASTPIDLTDLERNGDAKSIDLRVGGETASAIRWTGRRLVLTGADGAAVAFTRGRPSVC